MRYMNLTEHAQKRKQQRGISDLQIELIRAFGDDHYQKGGCTLSYISEKKIRQLRDAVDKLTTSTIASVKSPDEIDVTYMHMHHRIYKTQFAA